MIITVYVHDSAKNFEENEKLMHMLKRAMLNWDYNSWWTATARRVSTLRNAGTVLRQILEVSRQPIRLEILTEFNCKASSTWLSCDDWNGKTHLYTQKFWEKGRTRRLALHCGSQKLQRKVLHSQ